VPAAERVPALTGFPLSRMIFDEYGSKLSTVTDLAGRAHIDILKEGWKWPWRRRRVRFPHPVEDGLAESDWDGWQRLARASAARSSELATTSW
jgi:hypothetical protein